MEKKIKLDHNTLNSILEKQCLYHTSEGKLGKLADLSAYIIEEFDFSQMHLSDIIAIGSVFIRCKFINCELYGTIFDESKFITVNFKNSNLGKAQFYGVEAKNACFDDTNCSSAEFDESNLSGATFRNANLRGTSFTDCDLSNAVFDGADLEYASIVNNIEYGTSWKNVKAINIVS
ncbi:MAG: pentapeptide repeat-containing protein [Gomphosphaeria aponina SAG 52.96 = DSM 107014]|uniref:Pentapeptide repeat-containing protein n=1 Tax=Gomphosphaeria aponina SAG 52.96 = DSM 107014 TaxID=1521640 RepID=A0A941GS55_9CHRO|nr:pentapeptide repeat-containing protein [Gomphosphaeria aponina SAG 52.96 = DSM 107014]